ncbi:hypothetical protein CC78DRAFT_543116 [Lojkania enalia]|uniref:Mid2 domain-containing protein n=1 Tax=Lojkania enalia TaxID=147567 RepID=A0A9P4KBM6_9PLEO|nr:hypothetical protein CC78DRAFT_543116 [Didymosphaeria enalia]
MGPLMGVSKLSRISLLYFFSTSLSAVRAGKISTQEISTQASTCGGMSNLFQCGTEFPSDFCCPQGTACSPINGTELIGTVCCPNSASCEVLVPISCDVNQLNATQHPDNQIHISDTKDVVLPRCRDRCCPPGYTCQGGGCFAVFTSSTSSVAPSATVAPTASLSITDPASASQTGGAAIPAPIVQTEQGFDGKSFAAGFFPGIVLGGLLVIGLIWAVKKRREMQAKNRYSDDLTNVSRTISDPIYDPVYAARTDFIRRGSQSAQPSPSSIKMQKQNKPASGMTPRIKSLWTRSPRLGFGGFSANTTPAVAPLPPAVRAGNGDPYTTPTRTPNRTSSRLNKHKNQHPPSIRRSTSTGTIDVLMPAPSFLEPPKAPGMREHRMTQDSSNTTFTKLMERAGYEEESRNEVRTWKGR